MHYFKSQTFWIIYDFSTKYYLNSSSKSESVSLVTELIGYFTVYQCKQYEIHICHIGSPLNRADGGYRHIAAALFDLEAN